MENEQTWVVRYHHWHDDVDFSTVLVGPFKSRAKATEWARNAWEDGYDPCWDVIQLAAPWVGTMSLDETVNLQ